MRSVGELSVVSLYFVLGALYLDMYFEVARCAEGLGYEVLRTKHKAQSTKKN